MTNTTDVKIVNQSLFLYSKRHGVAYCTLRNDTAKPVRHVSLDSLTVSGVPVSYEPFTIAEIAPGESKDLEIEVTMPSKVPFDFVEDSAGGEVRAQVELAFTIHKPVSKEAFEALPEW